MTSGHPSLVASRGAAQAWCDANAVPSIAFLKDIKKEDDFIAALKLKMGPPARWRRHCATQPTVAHGRQSSARSRQGPAWRLRAGGARGGSCPVVQLQPGVAVQVLPLELVQPAEGGVQHGDLVVVYRHRGA